MNAPSAGWFPDPMQRHEMRYWDGTEWTEHIADGGQPGVDPVGAPAAPTEAAPVGAAPADGHALPAPQPGTAAAGQATGAPPATPEVSTVPVTTAPVTTAGRGGGWKVMASILAVTGLLVGLVVVFAGGDDDGNGRETASDANAAELFLEPALAVGVDPFTPSVDTNTAPPPIRIEPTSAPVSPTSVAPTTVAPTVTPTATPTTATPTTGTPTTATPTTVAPTTGAGTTPGGGTRSVEATRPGLYGGTRNNSACDPEQMIAFLAENPDKGAAWAGAQGISPADIPAYLRSLTPVVLRADTRVTNYGFRNGRAYAKPAVLQMGTAVLIDEYGIPRARCSCGNPLAPPTPLPAGHVYVGDPWPGFQPETVIVVVNTTNVVIDELVLVDLNGGYFGRTPAKVSPTGVVTDGEIYIDRLCDLFPTAPECLPPVPTLPSVPETLPPTTLPEPVLGTGDIQITLRWSSTADLDLAVLDPNGEEINFSQPSSSTGGQLDVDSNASCGSAVTNPVENVFWPTGASPAGVYTIQVRYYAECGAGVGPQPFTLTVSVNGVEVAVQPVEASFRATTDQVNQPGDVRVYAVDKGTAPPIGPPATAAPTTPPTAAPTTAPPTTAGPTPVTTVRPVVPPTTADPGDTMTLEDYCQSLYGPGATIGPEYPLYTLCMHDPTVT
jgi:hypothetical protein